MIHAMYDRRRLRLTVEGHAGAAEKGRDIVCAAASVLACTLAADVQRLTQKGIVARSEVYLQAGQAEVWAEPQGGHRKRVQSLFDDLCAGFTLLASQYPEYVDLKIKA